MSGKGDKPRNCFSERYRQNYNLIDWSTKKTKIKNNKKYERKKQRVAGS